MRAASELFTERGYHDTSVGGISERAGVSLGAFYQYFRDRADIVGALVVEGLDEMLHRTDTVWRPNEGPHQLYEVIESFVSAYLEAGALTRVWEEVCHTEPELAELRRDLGRVLTEPVERELLRGGENGWLRPFTPREARLAAVALTGMVDRYCYVTYVFDPPQDGAPSVQESARLLTDLWSAAVGFEREGSSGGTAPDPLTHTR